MKLSVKLQTVYDCRAFNKWLSAILTPYYNDVNDIIKVEFMADCLESVDDYADRLAKLFNRLHLIKCDMKALKDSLSVVIKWISF